MEATTLQLPNVLDGDVLSAEGLYSLVVGATPAGQYVLDMKGVGFVKPYGVIALITAIRHLAEKSDQPVCLCNMQSRIHSYLDRMNLFQVGSDWLQTRDTLDEEWFRSQHTLNLLELTTIARPDDVEAVVARARGIFSQWLMIPNLGDLLNVLSELCANIYQHSGDHQGCVLIQKYNRFSDGVTVSLAVGDLGCGIKGSLVARHGELGQETLDYLREAMSGKTSRASGRGGLGLRRVEQIVEARGGYLWLRSENAAILSRGQGQTQEHTGLISMPGTQVAVELDAPLHY